MNIIITIPRRALEDLAGCRARGVYGTDDPVYKQAAAVVMQAVEDGWQRTTEERMAIYRDNALARWRPA